MFFSRLDPGLYFQPYVNQSRRLSVELAMGDPSALKESFATPEYYKKPRMSHFIGTRFEVGLNVKNPVSTQEGMSFYSVFSNSTNLQMAMYNSMAKQAAVPEHVNLEGPTGQYLKTSMGLPYRAHSTVDPQASANFNPHIFRRKVLSLLNTEFEKLFDYLRDDKKFLDGLTNLDSLRGSASEFLNNKIDSVPGLRNKITSTSNKVNTFIKEQEVHIPFEEDRYSNVALSSVRDFFDELSEKYPSLIGSPRKALRDYYEFSERLLYKGVVSGNKYVSLAARTVTYREFVARESNFLYLIDPLHLVHRILRSAIGVSNYKYQSIALEGLVVGSLERRIVKVAGLALGLYEASREYKHFIHGVGHRIESFEESRKTDPFENEQNNIDEKRRRAAYENWKRGKPYDPTQTSADPRFTKSISERLHKFSPANITAESLDVIKHPSEHKDVFAGLAAYSAFALPHIIGGYKSKEGTVGRRLFESVLDFKKDPKLGYLGGVIGAVGFAIPSFIEAKTWANKLGSLGLLAGTLVAGKIGGELGVQLITKSSKARSVAASGFKLFAKGASFLEHPYFNSSIEKWLHEAESLERSELTPEFKSFARTLGQEFLGGELAEITLGYLFTTWFKKIGKGIDTLQSNTQNAISAINNTGKHKEKTENKRRDIKDYLLIQTARKMHVKDADSFLTPAYSQADILTNQNYSSTQKAVLTVLKNTGFGNRVLKTVSPIATKFRRTKAIKEVVRLKVKSDIKSQDLNPDIKQIKKAYDRYQEYGHPGSALNQDNQYSYG